ncbi:hypothetical protein QVM48_27955 [Pseudomonas soli]|jgi:type IV pilus assembly protein PilQ|uniref:hypothetical protein n=1 Tax=Pseudomonas soli TaxID=1306993 RepID=UPI00289393B7|nr:hypothetical protein [Pseudomonas soli]EKT4503709.1 hypothetical protein [Pseudomonas putida]MDT3717821.1 hypothetical protein [Pseudomonas soli]MDT3734542.1 hypothetical protein [Pseudomonas soli]
MKSFYSVLFLLLLNFYSSFACSSNEPLTFDFDAIPTTEALQLVADYSGRNLVVADDVVGSLTMRMKDVTWNDALDYIVIRKHLHVFESDGTIFVSKRKDYFSGDESSPSDRTEPYPMAIFKVRYVLASDAIKGFPLASEGGVTESLKANDLASIIVSRLSPKRTAELREYLRNIDFLRRQVMIEARIVEVDTSYSHSLGVNWSGTIGSGDLVGAVNSQLVAISSAVSTGSLGFSSGGSSLDARLAAMEKEGRGRIISRPRVFTADREQARIGRGTEVPYQQSAGDGATSVAFKEAALALDVTPVLDDSGALLSIKLSKDEPDYSSAVDGVPPIKTASLTSKVRVQLGSTVALGGVYANSNGETVKKVPGLSKIPLIGRWFQYRSHSDTDSELILFITIKEVTPESYARRS